MIRKTIYPVKNPFINFVINPNTYFGLHTTFLVSYFVYLRPAWMKITATMFPGSLDPLKLPLLYYAFPTPLKKFVKVFLILKQIPTFVFCIPTHFRIRVSAREFKVQSCKFLQHWLWHWSTLTLHLTTSFWGREAWCPTPKWNTSFFWNWCNANPD